MGVIVGIIAKFSIVDRLVSRFETNIATGNRQIDLSKLKKRAIKAKCKAHPGIKQTDIMLIENDKKSKSQKQAMIELLIGAENRGATYQKAWRIFMAVAVLIPVAIFSISVFFGVMLSVGEGWSVKIAFYCKGSPSPPPPPCVWMV